MITLHDWRSVGLELNPRLSLLLLISGSGNKPGFTIPSVYAFFSSTATVF
jgi:hypothetical protein